LRHEEFNQGCEATCNGPYARPWSKTMIGFGSENDTFVFELTYNYGIHHYKIGNDVRHVQVAMPNSWSPPSHFTVQAHNDMFTLSGPDNVAYHVTRGDFRPHVAYMSLNVSDIVKSKAFYVETLGLVPIPSHSQPNHTIQVAWRVQDETRLELAQIEEEVRHEEAFGRIAFACPDVAPIAEKVRSVSEKMIKHGPVKLETPGKATVEVVIVEDGDGYEICFVEVTGFDQLAAYVKGGDEIDWHARGELGADQA